MLLFPEEITDKTRIRAGVEFHAIAYTLIRDIFFFESYVNILLG
ncbi:hypothetical protein [Moorena producens]|nr:hypothetical protein [Moorena producens]